MLRPGGIVLLLLLAGCSGSPEADAEPAGTSGPSSSSMAPAAPPAPTVEVVPFSFDGNLGTSAHGCVFPAATCHTQDFVPGTSDLLVERPGANVTALSFTVTWTAQTPATETLTVGSMVMVSCDGCNSTQFGELQGVSPLQVDVTGVSVPLHAEALIHVYVYNPKGLVYDPAVPGYAVLSTDQAFHIEGTATLLVPS